MFSTALHLLMYSLAGNRNFARKNYISQPLPPMPFSSPEAALLLVSTQNRASGQVQHRNFAIHGLPVTLRMLRVKHDKSGWFWSQSIVSTKPFKPDCRWTGPETRFLVLTKRSANSGDENAQMPAILGDSTCAVLSNDIHGAKIPFP